MHCHARSEGHARRARGGGMDNPTLRDGPDKQVPPSAPDATSASLRGTDPTTYPSEEGPHNLITERRFGSL